MDESILESTKKVLNIPPDYKEFDSQIVLFINSVFSTLNQLGVGPDDGFSITDETAEWSDYVGEDKRLNNVKSYVYLRVRLLFDPPTNSFLVTSMQEQVKEHEFRLNVYVEGERWDEWMGDSSYP